MNKQIDGKQLINWLLYESRIHKPLIDAVEITPLVQKIKQMMGEQNDK